MTSTHPVFPTRCRAPRCTTSTFAIEPSFEPEKPTPHAVVVESPGAETREPISEPARLARCRILATWGDFLEAEAGILHVASVNPQADGSLRGLAIGAGAPGSEIDRFSLSVARARVDAIVTTGRILRREPDLCHDLPEDLRAWRREVLGKESSPVVVVLSRSGALPLDHPVFDRQNVVVVVPPSAEAETRAKFIGRRTEIVTIEDLTPRSLIESLRWRGLDSLCIEAGPSTSMDLYRSPGLVDELMLSIFEQRILPEDQIVGALPPPDFLRSHFGLQVAEYSQMQGEGLWRFRRYRRETRG